MSAEARRVGGCEHRMSELVGGRRLLYLSLCLGYRDALLAAPPAALTPFAVGGADPFITLTQLPALVP